MLGARSGTQRAAALIAQSLSAKARRYMIENRVDDKIDALIASFYAAFDNRNGVRPQRLAMTECFTQKATIVRAWNSGVESYTVDEFVSPRIELLTHGSLRDFHEWETGSTTQVFNRIAARTSHYRKAGLLDGNDYSGSGTKCFHLVDLGLGWRIASLVWVDDNA